MQADSNFCIFVEEKSVKWSFGNPDDEFLTFVINFLTGLSQIGQEIFGQHGVASIEFESTRRFGFLSSSEVFIVSLMNKFFLIMSDPQTTIKLIDARGGIPREIHEIMSAVLVGQAAMLFSQCITDVENEETRAYLESLWQDIILDISQDYSSEIEKIVSRSSSNFSILKFEDLFCLHYYLRKQPELVQPLSPAGWALVSHVSGGEIPLDYHVESRDPVVLAGYLGIIISFVNALFDSKPKSLIFGTNTIQKLSFINGNLDYFLAIDSPVCNLMLNEDFREAFFLMKEKVHQDLQEPLKKRIIEEIIELKTQELEQQEIQTLLDDALSYSKKYYSKKQPERRRLFSRIFNRF
ncbi:MAG: hypothetical protein ACFFAJ_04020 [Candidatus Hodarchaeota archaeon]